MKKYLFVGLAISILAGVALQAQSNQPVVIQAITPQSGNTPRAATVQATTTAPSPESTLKLLQDIKAANAAVLSKQAETIQQLDDLEKAADQIRIFSKRG